MTLGGPSGGSAIVEPLEARRVDRPNTVLGRAARFDLVQRDGVLREIGAGPFRSPTSGLGHGSANGRAVGHGDNRGT